jgi:glutamate/tyrosine decarboxylase-like PLP-dependent enzyme
MDAPLQLTAEDMRREGYRTIDALVEALTADRPVLKESSPAAMREAIDAPPPTDGSPFDQVLADLLGHLDTRAVLGAGGYLAFIPGFANWPGALADLIASALNIDACWWAGASAATQLELTVLAWFADWIGYPHDADGVLVSGGSAANLTALGCAREIRAGEMRDDLVIYVSNQSHSSVARAARTRGFRPERVRVVATDRSFRMSTEALERAMTADRRSGLTPLAVCANAGTTNTGAVDPLGSLATLCEAHGAWLHVDAAYGGFAALTERGKATLAGIERADSVALDPHKWLYQPFECGALLVREHDTLRRAFRIMPDYLRDVSTEASVNLSDRGLQLTRSSRALKVWTSVQTFGLDAFRQAIDTSLDLAQEAGRRIDASETLELMAPVELGVVAVRRHPAGTDDERVLTHLNDALVAEIERSRDILVSSTRLFGRTAIRMCFLNPTTTRQHLDRALDLLEHASVEPDRADSNPPGDRNPDVLSGWLGRTTSDAGDLARIELFAELDDPPAFAGRGRELRLLAGEPLIEQWDAGRDMHVILEGSVRVSQGEHDLATLGPGEFVGELAALDWGGGYGTLRNARVEAITDARVLSFDPADVRELLMLSPAARTVIEEVAQQRLRAGVGDR